MSKPFKLSAALFGHSLDVRAIVTTKDNSILSGSRDKSAKFWRPNVFNPGYTESIAYKDQKNFVGAVLYLEPSNDYPDGLVITAGYDNIILIYRPSEPFATYSIQEHTNAVCCLCKGLAVNTFLSGSWDMTAKMWSVLDTKASITTYTGHAAAIWSVIQLKNENIVTACADRTIGIWVQSGQQIRSLTGHTDCVRGVIDFPELNRFMSVSNDASIKVWTYGGENVDTYYGHTNYIYSIARNEADSETSFVTSDEDYTVRYWKDGLNTQVITLPAQSIWAVGCLTNGDVVTGSSDGVVRIFTQDEDRFASEEDLKVFNEEVNATKKEKVQEIGGYKVSDLPGKEALYNPGKKAGQMKMIREPSGVVAYTWVDDGDNSHWEKVGDVLGANDKANEGKTLHEGQAYDFVFSVDVEDGKPPLKLPYNKGEDVYSAANKFLERNGLPAIYLDQIVEFILKNSQDPNAMQIDSNYVDPFTGSSRYTPIASNSGTASSAHPVQGASSSTVSSGSNADPFTGGSSYTTQQTKIKRFFPHTSYLRFDMGDSKVILNKLKEFNQKTGDGTEKVDEELINTVVQICDGDCTNNKVLDGLFKLLQWPNDIIFPVLDVVRLAIRHEMNNNMISMKDNGVIFSKLKNFISKDCIIPNNTLVSFRALCNFFLFPSGEALIFIHRIDLLETITSLSSTNKNIQIGLSTFLLNLTILTLKKKDEVSLILLASVLPDILQNISDAEAQFRACVAMGTLISSGDMSQRKALKSKILENTNFISKIQLLSSLYGNDLELKRMQCAAQVQTELLQ